MSTPSRWPLPADGIRFITPHATQKKLRSHMLSQGLYITAMGYYPCATLHAMQRTDHPDHILIYCTAGKGFLTVDGVIQTVNSGDIVYLPSGSHHHYHADSQNPWTIYWLHFDGMLANNFAQHINPVRKAQLRVQHTFSIGVQPRIIRVFDGVAQLRHRHRHLAEFIQAGHQVQALLSYVALLVQQRNPYTDSNFDTEHIRAIMQENIHGQLNLDKLAQASQLSKYHFSKKFKKVMGESPINYFINMKIQRACYLLDSTSRSVKQIASELGYQDCYYFSRLFKKHIGIAPTSYRKAKL